MSRKPRGLAGIAATALLCLAAVGPAGAQSVTGQITGRVTSPAGNPLPGIDVAAVPVGGDAVVGTTSDADGRYTLTLDPGTYDVGFNATVFGPIDDTYEATIYGGPGPGPDDPCVICHGRGVTVTAGVVTTGIDAALTPSPFTPVGFVRPLTGKTVRARGGRMTFNVGCHEYPDGCSGTASLRLGTSAAAPTIATTQFSFPVNAVGQLHFTLPPAVRTRLHKIKARGLNAVVEVVTPQDRTLTHLKLVERD